MNVQNPCLNRVGLCENSVLALRRAVAGLGPDSGRRGTAPLRRREHPPTDLQPARGASCAPPVCKTARRGETGIWSNAKSSSARDSLQWRGRSRRIKALMNELTSFLLHLPLNQTWLWQKHIHNHSIWNSFIIIFIIISWTRVVFVCFSPALLSAPIWKQCQYSGPCICDILV